MKDPDKLFFDIAHRFAQQSKCKSRQVGCVVVYEDRVIGQGFNGAPEGSSCDNCPRPKCHGGEHPTGSNLDFAICAHSEANAIGYCARHGITTRGATMYCTVHPCAECAKLLVAAGIKEMIFQEPYTSDNLANSILEKAGIKVRKHVE